MDLGGFNETTSQHYWAGIALAALVAPAMAYSYDRSENRVVGTSYTQQSWEDYCYMGTCALYYSFRLTEYNCSKTMYERVMFQRDLLPDQTSLATGPVSTCNLWGYPVFNSGSPHGHHQDARVTSGSATVYFRTHGS